MKEKVYICSPIIQMKYIIYKNQELWLKRICLKTIRVTY